MKPLYLTTPVRQGLGTCLRPGGLALTKRIVQFIKPGPATVVLDAGCGQGATMGYLHDQGMREIIGLDLDYNLLREAKKRTSKLARGELAHLPLPDSCLDMVLCECVWNLTQKRQVLEEFARVMKPGASIAVSDMYSRSTGSDDQGDRWPVHCCFSQATDLDSVCKLFCDSGFSVQIVEDHTPLLKRTAAEFVFTHGSIKAFWQAVTGDSALAEQACRAASGTRPGLFLLIAIREGLVKSSEHCRDNTLLQQVTTLNRRPAIFCEADRRDPS